jgi:hypothetical protein
MLYDQSVALPQSGSPLESVFILLAKRRQEVEYYRTKLMVASNLAPHSEEGAKMLTGAWDDYRDAVFPFLAGQRAKKDVEAKKVLDWWGKRMLKIRPLWRANERKGLVSKLRKGMERVRESEKLRRRFPHRRI